MKRGFLFFVGILGLAGTLPACAYREQLRTWERYEPTPFYRQYAQPRPAREIPPLAKDADFEKQLAELRAVKTKWEKAVEEGAPKERGFYLPDPGRLRELARAEKELSAAGAVLVGDFTLEDLEILAWLRNPGVKAAKKNTRAAIEAYDQVSNLDEILRQYTAFTRGLMTGIGSMQGAESMEMKFPFPGVMALKGQIVTQEVLASREREAMAARMALTQIRQAYWNLLFSIQAQRITGDTVNLLRRLESVARTRYETGNTNFQDLIKIRIEREKMEEELKTLREQQGNQEIKILEVLDLPPATRVGPPMARTPSPEIPALDLLYPLALEKRQELREMRAMIGKMERMIEMAETMIYPPYTLGLSFYPGETVPPPGGMSQPGGMGSPGGTKVKETFPAGTMASMGAGLPRMPWYGTNNAYLRETRQKLAALREDLKRVEDETIFKVREAWFRLDRSRREEALYSARVINLSQAALEVSTRGYETGNVAFADVIMSYTGWLNDHLMAEMRRSDLGMALADLEEVIGGKWK